MSCSACKLSGGAMPLSYVNPSYREPSAYAGSDRVISEVGLARPVLNATGGKRSLRKRNRTRRNKKTKGKAKAKTMKKRGGFYPSVMGNFVQNASRLIPAAGVTGYRMFKNYKKNNSMKTRKNRKAIV